jgi:hypothetical protein
MSVTGQQLWQFCPNNISQVLNIALGYKHVFVHIFLQRKTKIQMVTLYVLQEVQQSLFWSVNIL